jgi:hypothetical protein
VPFSPRARHELDQFGSAIQEFPPVLRSYFRALLEGVDSETEERFTREEALMLVLDLQARLLGGLDA